MSSVTATIVDGTGIVQLRVVMPCRSSPTTRSTSHDGDRLGDARLVRRCDDGPGVVGDHAARLERRHHERPSRSASRRTPDSAGTARAPSHIATRRPSSTAARASIVAASGVVRGTAIGPGMSPVHSEARTSAGTPR